MTIEPAPDYEEEIYRKLEAALAKERQRGEDIHASDLSSPMKAYWQRVHPLPPTRDEIAFWLTGRAHHYFMVHAQTGVDDSQEESLYVQDLDLYYSPDLNTAKGEFKTSRSWRIPDSEEEALRDFESYEKQCRVYAAARKVTEWYLVVLYLNPPPRELDGRKVPLIRAYKYSFTKKEILDERKKIKRQVAEIRTAIQQRDPSSLSWCTSYFCYKKVGQGRGRPSKIVPLCKYFDICKPPAPRKDDRGQDE